MKILIIGGGIGGLAMYHAIRKYLSESVTVKIFEAYPSATTTKNSIGGGLGLAPNGLRALTSLSEEIANYIVARGLGIPTFILRNSTGVLIGSLYGGSKERYGFDHLRVPRAVVHDAVLNGIPDGVLEWSKRAKEVRETEEGVEVVFEDGTVERGDLVIGADGVKSVVRKAIFGDKYPVEYDGLTGVGGLLPVTSLTEELRKSLDTEPLSMTFGPQGSFGYSLSSPRTEDISKQQILWWSNWEATPAPTRNAPIADIRAQLLEHHEFWKSPHDAPGATVFPTIISLSCGSDADTPRTVTAADRKVLVLPRHMTPRLPRWSSSSGRIVLIGDAAHAMPPVAGQGVACAVEDAVAIGLLLKHYLASSEDADVSATLKETVKAYEEIRVKRLGHILDASRRAGDTKRERGKWQEWIRDTVLWVFSMLPESVHDWRYAYNIESEVDKYLSTRSRSWFGYFFG